MHPNTRCGRAWGRTVPDRIAENGLGTPRGDRESTSKVRKLATTSPGGDWAAKNKQTHIWDAENSMQLVRFIRQPGQASEKYAFLSLFLNGTLF